MLSGRFDSGFALQLMAKDLGIAVGLGEAMHSRMTLAPEVLDVSRPAAQTLGPSADHTEMYRYLQELQQ